MERTIGQVKFFNKDRGFGFVRCLKDDKDLFVHFSAITTQKNCWHVLYPGEYIEFEIEESDKGQQVKNVTGIYNGTLLCEHGFEYYKRRANPKEKNEVF
jgi:cold shock protein